MSAIAGLWRFDGKPDASRDCARMLTAQRIYGPDDSPQWSNGPLALGRQLFRTLPEDAFDTQPQQTPGGRLTLVADVRLDNRDELIAALGLPTPAARQQPDARILLEALERWGEDSLNRIVGDFAFALWDNTAQHLLLARDFLGQRILHYYRGAGFFAFATMPQGLHALAEIPCAPDEQMLAEFVTMIPQHTSRSFFHAVERLEPGHVATVTPGGISVRRYWNPRRSAVRMSAGDCVDGLRHHLDQATQSRLRRAGGTVATQLSSGFDSSSVTATAAHLLAAGGEQAIALTAVPRKDYDGPCPAYRIGDEGPLAATVAAMYPNLKHITVRSGHLSPVRDLDRNFSLFQRPLLNLSNRVWLNALNAEARDRGATVLLTGNAGNMTLSYDGIELLPEALRAFRIFTLARETAGLLRSRRIPPRSLPARTLGPFLPAWLWQRATRTFDTAWQDILQYTAIRPEQLAELNLRTIAKTRGLDFSYRPWKDGFTSRVWGLRRFDQGYFNMGTLAGWGLDQRDPTGDKRLVDFCLSVPMEQYLVRGMPRALARRALADRVPQAILNARTRGFQAVDWHEGLSKAQGEVAQEIERFSGVTAAARILDISRMKGLVKHWPVSGWNHRDVMQSYLLALLRGVSTGHFIRKAAEGGQ